MGYGAPETSLRRFTILEYLNNGKVVISLSDANTNHQAESFEVDIPLSWAGPEGQFIGGHPDRGSTVICRKSLGEWHIVSYIPSDGVFTNFDGTPDTTQMSRLEPGCALIQVASQINIHLDPDDGIRLGKGPTRNILHIDPLFDSIDNGSIISKDFSTSLSFTDAARSMDGMIHRDINSPGFASGGNTALFGSLLTSQSYERVLDSVGLDPQIGIGFHQQIDEIPAEQSPKNPPLSESRTIYYECSPEFEVRSDRIEFDSYKGSPTPKVPNNRTNIRADTLSLSLSRPNNLIEETKGTVVDAAGNVLDLNRNILPVGQVSGFSFDDSEDVAQSFARIRSQLRKSMAFHFEINARKGFEINQALSDNYPEIEGDTYNIVDPPSIQSTENYARCRSRFFLDIDKEGQFKLNVPASSEVGNIGLLTRYENYSNVEAFKGLETEVQANTFIFNEDYEDILIENFATYKPGELKENDDPKDISGVALEAGDSNLEDYTAPLDRFTDKRIKLGTAYHDISYVLSEFQPDKSYRSTASAPTGDAQDYQSLVPYDKSQALNLSVEEDPAQKSFDYIISEKITVSGETADGGGRSGTLNLDGMINVNIGANTVDRQSVWFDYAGGVVGRVGRDKQGISYATSFDGDVLLQVGGEGLGGLEDSRFIDQSSGYRNGTFELRVLGNQGVMSILRIYPNGIDIVTPGQMRFSSGGNMVLHSNSDILLDAPIVRIYKDEEGSSSRTVLRKPNISPIV